jgi:AAA domain
MTAQEKLAQKQALKSEPKPTLIVPVPNAPPPMPKKVKFTIQGILKDAITHETEIVPANHICTINDANFLTDGELSTVSGPPKTGKSTVVSYIIATALMKEIPENCDTLKIRTMHTTKNIVYIDTEQNISGTALTLQRVLKIAGLTECPTNLKYFNVRKYSIEERIEHLKVICDNLTDISFIVIDGITDYVTGVNDEISSNEVIEMLMNYSSYLNIPILNIIHETAGGKIRGQLGSQLERKVGGAISIQKDRERKCFIIKPKFIRYGADFDDIYYHYNLDTGLIQCLSDYEVNSIKKEEDGKNVKVKELKEILDKVYAGSTDGMNEKDLRKGIKHYQSNKEGASRDAINGLTKRHFENVIKYELTTFNNHLYFYLSDQSDLFSNPIVEQKPEFQRT